MVDRPGAGDRPPFDHEIPAILPGRAPRLDQAPVSRAIFDESLKLWQAPAAELGRSDPAAWAVAAKFMKDMGLIQTAVNPNDLYTNDFIKQ